MKSFLVKYFFKKLDFRIHRFTCLGEEGKVKLEARKNTRRNNWIPYLLNFLRFIF